jgi:hypothetical protein
MFPFFFNFIKQKPGFKVFIDLDFVHIYSIVGLGVGNIAAKKCTIASQTFYNIFKKTYQL